MAKPKNLKEAVDRGYRIKEIFHKYGNKVQVNVIAQIFNPNNPSCSFLMDKDYMERNYPQEYKTKLVS